MRLHPILFAFIFLSLRALAVDVIDAGDDWFAVRFTTDPAMAGEIRYGTGFDDLDSINIFPSAQAHIVNITGLEKDTLYYFDIVAGGVDDNSGRHYRFVTNIGDGRTYFMSDSGTDAPGSGSFDSPFKTLGYAKARLAPGDTLLVMDGVYKGVGTNAGIVFSHDADSGTIGNPVTIRAYNKGYGSHPVFDSEFSSSACGDYHCYVFKLSFVHDLVFDSIWVRNVENFLDESGGFIQRYSDRIDFKDCWVSSIKGGPAGELSGAFMFCGTHGSRITGARAWDIHGESTNNKGVVNVYYGAGEARYAVNVSTEMSEFWDVDAGAQVKSWGQEDISFSDNYLHDIIYHGIHDIGANTETKWNIIYNCSTGHATLNDYAHDPSQRPVVEHNTIINSQTGVDFADWHIPVVEVDSFKDNIVFADSPGYQRLMSTYYPASASCCQAPFDYADYNLFFNPTDATVIRYANSDLSLDSYRSASGLETHSRQLDPLFRDVKDRDFRLAQGSPARALSAEGSYIGAIPPDEVIGRVEINPLDARGLGAGDHQLFIVKVFSPDGKEYPPGHFPIVWSATSGAIDRNGLYTSSGSSAAVSVSVAAVVDSVGVNGLACGNGICDPGEDHVYCPGDCCLPMTDQELFDIIGLWKSGLRTMIALLDAIGRWKAGC